MRNSLLEPQDQIVRRVSRVTKFDLAPFDEMATLGSLELRDITEGVGPMHTIVSLGCAGWSAGQLDREMAENVWLSLPASAQLVFDHDHKTLWEHGFATLGIDPGFFAGNAGTA